MNTEPLSDKKKLGKILGIGVMIFGILCLNYLTFSALGYRHAFYRILFYLPLVFGCIWFGIKGAMYVTGSVFLLYVPYVARTWQGFTLEDFHKILEGLLFVMIASILGLLVERERRKNKEYLQIERLAALGRATSEVAHDMKTPLMAIGGFASQIHRKLEPGDPSKKKLEIVIQESARLEAMIREMLDFGRPIHIEPVDKGLADLISESVSLAQAIGKHRGIEIKTELEASLPVLPLDVDRLKQTLLNVLANAIEASDPEECVIVRVHCDKREAVVEITDCGRGIEDELQEKVFTPFFTTKNKGTGLGLAIVKKTIEAHGGSVSFRRNPERGVTFALRLPLFKHET
jgi:two-component system, NtrC family, sensor histidine kinase HydH